MMIRIKNISKTFYDRKRGEIKAVLPTSFEIKKGEVFGLLGPNGAGKSTLLRMLATILTPGMGSAEINGYDLKTQTNEIKRSIGFLSGNTKLYGRMSPKELMFYLGELYEMELHQIKNRCENIFQMLGMIDFADQRIEKLSTGQTQKTSIARCILHDPPIFYLDEPTLGLDVLTSRAIIQFIRSAAENGKTIILSTHYMEEAELLCHRIGLMHQGRILDIDSLAGLQKKCGKERLTEIFLNYLDLENGVIHEV